MNITLDAVTAALVRVLAAALLCGPFAAVEAAEYCCTCKGQTTGKTLDAGNRGVALGQCSLECGGFTNVTPGKCAAPVPAPPPAAAPAVSESPGNLVLAYKSEDCSGEPLRITGSTARLEQGIASFQVDAGAPASAWEKPDYAGRHTELVGPSICVSPGFDISSIKLR
jgi:hypothetical protein